MDVLRMGTLIGLCAVFLILLLIVTHYWRERRRQRLLRHMSHDHWWDVMRQRH